MHHLLCLNSLDWCFVLLSPSSNTFICWTPTSIKTCHEFWFGGVVLVQVFNCKAFGPALYCSFGKPQHDISMVWSRLSLPYESIRDYPTCTLAWCIWSDEGLELIVVVWICLKASFDLRIFQQPTTLKLKRCVLFLSFSLLVYNSFAWCVYWPTPSCSRHWHNTVYCCFHSFSLLSHKSFLLRLCVFAYGCYRTTSTAFKRIIPSKKGLFMII